MNPQPDTSEDVYLLQKMTKTYNNNLDSNGSGCELDESEESSTVFKYEEHIQKHKNKEYQPNYLRRGIPILSFMVLYVIQNFLIGNSYADSILGVELCSTGYWLIKIIYTAILLISFIITYILVRYEDDFHGEIGYFIDYKWSLKDL